jgi:hypothetical protein
MHLLKRLRPSPAMVVAGLALLTALGGTSYAAVQAALPRNSVTTIQVKDFSLLARDFKRGQVPRGATGPAGPAGAAGPAGPQGPPGPSGATIKWALVRPDGGIAAQSGGITLAAKPGAGTYVLSIGIPITGKPILATGGFASDASDQRGETTAAPCGAGTEGRTCPVSNNTSSVFVETRGNGGTPADHSFYIVIFL